MKITAFFIHLFLNIQPGFRPFYKTTEQQSFSSLTVVSDNLKQQD